MVNLITCNKLETSLSTSKHYFEFENTTFKTSMFTWEHMYELGNISEVLSDVTSLLRKFIIDFET